MLSILPYNAVHAVEYARRWAFARSPLFESYNGIGGDCTNFVSQCVYAGSCQMNYTMDFGWYYISPTNRAPAWTGVEFFYNFMTSNMGIGPFMSEAYAHSLELGDVIQLGDEEGDYFHTLIVTGFTRGDYLVAAHSNDSLDRPLSSYSFARARFLHVEGVRVYVNDENCFEKFLLGEKIHHNYTFPLDNGDYL